MPEKIKKPRTEAQKAATAKLVAANKVKREAKKNLLASVEKPVEESVTMAIAAKPRTPLLMRDHPILPERPITLLMTSVSVLRNHRNADRALFLHLITEIKIFLIIKCSKTRKLKQSSCRSVGGVMPMTCGTHMCRIIWITNTSYRKVNWSQNKK